ncbi:hypothetical protein TI04_07765 [Achromatium sp. WMS2]|nr:hypothetical protein TI04_07765 [Achromatium sp. WMS2]
MHNTNTIHANIANIMSDLMMVFLFIAVIYMVEQEVIVKQVQSQNQAVVAIAKATEHSQKQINQA